MSKPHDRARRLARQLRQIKRRVTDLEQGRPPDAAERRIETVGEDVTLDDTVSESKRTDPFLQYDTADAGYDINEYES